MSPGPTFDRVYVWLKAQLVAGTLVLGAALEPAHLTDELATSITPIRDALHRLVGERLVDAARGEGFRVPSPTEADLRSLYAWNFSLLDLAVRTAHPSRLAGDVDDDLPAMADIALAIARRGGTEHLAAIASLNDRLGAARAAESRVLGDSGEELSDLISALRAHDDRSLRRDLGAYTRRRIRAVSDIVVGMRDPNI